MKNSENLVRLIGVVDEITKGITSDGRSYRTLLVGLGSEARISSIPVTAWDASGEYKAGDLVLVKGQMATRKIKGKDEKTFDRFGIKNAEIIVLGQGDIPGALNECILIGRLGSDPRHETTKAGKAFVRLGIAVTESSKNDKNEWMDETTWFNVDCYGYAMEKAEKFSKGDTVEVVCSLSGRESKSEEKVFHNISLFVERLTGITRVKRETQAKPKSDMVSEESPDF